MGSLCRQQDDGLLDLPALPEGAIPQPAIPARRRRQVDDDRHVGDVGNDVVDDVTPDFSGTAVIEKASRKIEELLPRLLRLSGFCCD